MILSLAYYLLNQILEGQIISQVAPSSDCLLSKSWLFLFIVKLHFSKRSRFWYVTHLVTCILQTNFLVSFMTLIFYTQMFNLFHLHVYLYPLCSILFWSDQIYQIIKYANFREFSWIFAIFYPSLLLSANIWILAKFPHFHQC